MHIKFSRERFTSRLTVECLYMNIDCEVQYKTFSNERESNNSCLIINTKPPVFLQQKYKWENWKF